MDVRTAGAFDRELGASVRSVRLEARVSQETLAEALGVTFQQVQKYEKGVNRISAARLFDIADALRVEPEKLTEKARKVRRAVGSRYLNRHAKKRG